MRDSLRACGHHLFTLGAPRHLTWPWRQRGARVKAGPPTHCGPFRLSPPRKIVQSTRRPAAKLGMRFGGTATAEIAAQKGINRWTQRQNHPHLTVIDIWLQVQFQVPQGELRRTATRPTRPSRWQRHASTVAIARKPSYQPGALFPL